MENKKSFEKSSIIVFAIMLITNIITYLFQIVLANMSVSVEEYGISNTLNSLYAVLCVPSTTLILVVTRYVLLTSAEKKGVFSYNMRLLLYFFALIMCVSGLLLIPLFYAVLGLTDVVGLIILDIGVLFAILSSFPVGLLQGEKDFLGYGIQGVVNAVFKLACIFFLLKIGANSRGTAVALVCGSVAAYGYSLFRSRRFHVKSEREIDFGLLKSMIRYGLGVLATQFVTSFMVNGDLLLVKYLFDEKTVGLYSAAMMFGKISTYLTGAIIAVLFPFISEGQAKGKDVLPVLKKALIYGVGISVLCAVGINFWGEWIIGSFLGERYLKALIYLPAVFLYIIPFVALNILINYMNALGKLKIPLASLIICCMMECLFCGVCRKDIHTLMFGLGIIMTVVFVINYIYISQTDKQKLLH